MFNRIAFAGSYSKFFNVNISDLNKREFYILLNLVLFTVALGIYPAPVLDGLHYQVTTLIYFVPDLDPDHIAISDGLNTRTTSSDLTSKYPISK